MTFKTIFLCLSIAFVCGQEFPRKTSNHSKSSQHFIFNGEVARTDEALFMVALLCVKSFAVVGPVHESICGGVLIDSTTILTAAHCVLAKCDKFLVRYGTHKVDKREFPDIEVDLEKNIIIHEKYNPEKKDIGIMRSNDIAIVKLPYSPNAYALTFVRFVELPKSNSYGFIKLGTEVTTYGWGYTNEITEEEPTDLMKTTLKIIDHLNEQIRYEMTEVEKWSQIYCVGVSDKGSYTCSGDSGGPLILDNVLIGITSGSLGECGEPDRLSIFSKVAYFRKWIEENRYRKERIPNV